MLAPTRARATIADVNSVLPYRDPLVRDLYWALTGAPLLRRTDSDMRWLDSEWFSDIGQRCRHRLLLLDHDPQPLRQALQTPKDALLAAVDQAGDVLGGEKAVFVDFLNNLSIPLG